MKVILVEHTNNAERLCAIAAKLTHEPEERDFLEMYIGTEEEHMWRVLKNCIDSGHDSVLEHATFTFYAEGISRALTHQLVRHRMASYSQQSQRYVPMKKPTFVLPPFDTIKDENGNLCDVASSQAQDVFEEYMNVIWELYNKFKDQGMLPQDARFVLPNACTTKIMITMNARALRNFFKLRLDKHAQWEIRKMANLMYDLVMEVAPHLFEGVKEEEKQTTCPLCLKKSSSHPDDSGMWTCSNCGAQIAPR